MEKKCAISSIIYWLLVPLLVNFIVFILPHFVTFVSFMTILCWGTTYGQRCDIRLWIYDEKYFQPTTVLPKLFWPTKVCFEMNVPLWMTFVRPFLAIFFQTVLLRCLRSLNLNWHKSYDKKHKNAKNKKDGNICFCTKLPKKEKWKYLCFMS